MNRFGYLYLFVVNILPGIDENQPRGRLMPKKVFEEMLVLFVAGQPSVKK